MTVPALPGARTSADTTIGDSPANVSSSRSTSRKRPTATRPAGVTASLKDASARSSTRVTMAAPSRSAYVSAAAGVANTSMTRSGASRAASTAFGPSTRKSRRSARTERRLSFRASLTRLFPAVRSGISTGSMSEESGRDRGVDVLGQGCLGDLDERDEGRHVVDGQLGQDLAVDLDAGQAEALDEAVVGQPVARAPALIRRIQSLRNSPFFLRRSL